MTPNSLARRRRLGAALIDLRDKCGYSAAELGRESGVSASVISRLEYPFTDPGRRPNLRYVRMLLDALKVPRGSDLFTAVEGYAEAAAAGGWWDAHPHMGAGQRTSAVVEAGAKTIDDYAGLLLPGLVQTAAYAAHRARTAGGTETDAIVAGRLERQRRALGSATYRLVLEEQAVRRPAAPPAAMLEQLHHLLEVIEQPGVSIRIVPVDADLGDGIAPRSPYGHITYPDHDDPPIVIVDNATEVSLVTDVAEVEGYAQLHERLRGAALSDADSAALIRQVADSLAARI